MIAPRPLLNLKAIFIPNRRQLRCVPTNRFLHPNRNHCHCRRFNNLSLRKSPRQETTRPVGLLQPTKYAPWRDRDQASPFSATRTPIRARRGADGAYNCASGRHRARSRYLLVAAALLRRVRRRHSRSAPARILH